MSLQIASFNGKLVYSLSMTGIKVLMYFAPGEEVEHINFPDVCDRLKDAHCQFGEWMSSTFTATEVSKTNGPKNQQFTTLQIVFC